MNAEEERRMNKERRKRQKRRRKERLKEKAKQERIEDRRRRIENQVERLVEERISRKNDGNAAHVNAEAPAAGQAAKKESVDVSRKRKAREITQSEKPPKKARAIAPPTEISPSSVSVSTKLLGAGSYAKCYLASYRGLDVVSKEITVKALKNETRGEAESRVRQELVYEARIIRKLGDHQGVPLVFGVCSESAPFRMILQFHGDRSRLESLTINRALSERIIEDKKIWLEIVKKFAEALLHIHEVGFLHNDLKSNNVILDIVKQSFNPVIIDFGKSLPMSGLKGPKILSEEKQKKYRKEFPHIAPEIVTGKRGQSVKSDIYSFGRVVNSIFSKAKLGHVPEVVRRTLSEDPEKRPVLQEVLKAIL